MMVTYIKGSFMIFLTCLVMLSKGEAQCTYKVERTEICYEVDGDSAKCESKKDIYIAGVDAPLAVMAISEITGTIVFKFVWYRPDGEFYTQWSSDTLGGACGFYWFVNTPGAIPDLPTNLGTWKVDFQISYNGEAFKSVGTEKFVVSRKATCVGMDIVGTFICGLKNLDSIGNCTSPAVAYIAGKDEPVAMFKYWEFTGSALLRFTWRRPDGMEYRTQLDTIIGNCVLDDFFVIPGRNPSWVGVIPDVPENIGEWTVDIQISINGEAFKTVGTETFQVKSPCEGYKILRSDVCLFKNLDPAGVCSSPSNTFLAGKDEPASVVAFTETNGVVSLRYIWYRPDGQEYSRFTLDSLNAECGGGYWYYYYPGVIADIPAHLGVWKVTIEISLNDSPFEKIADESFTLISGNANSTVLTLDLGEAEVSPKEEVLIPLYTKNFKDVFGFQFSIKLASPNLEILELVPTPAISTFNSRKVDDQTYGFIWVSETAEAITVQDSSILLWVKVKLKEGTENTDCIPVNIINNPVDLIAFQSIDGVPVEVLPEVLNGQVCIRIRLLGEIKGTITYHGAKPFGNATVILSNQSISNANNPAGLGLQIGTTSGELGQEVVVPISVINYKGVSGFQGTFKIDSRDVQITKLSSTNVNFVITSNIINPQVVSFVGYSDQPLTLTDGTPLLSLSLKVTNNANPNNCVLIEASNAPVELLATQTIAGGEQSVNPVILAGILGIGAVDCAGTPGLQQHTLSDAQGAYGFKNLLQGEVYTITPIFSKQHRNGVNVADLIVLRQHVLAQKTLGEKSLFIAGDVDNNKALGLMDLVQIQRLILGEIDSFSGVHSWRFVANTYLQDAGRAWTNLPYDFQAELNTAELKVDFTGIKLGDLTRSAQLRSGETLPLSTPDKRFTTGQLLQSVFSMNAQHLEGFQLEFDYNAQVLSFEGLSQFSDVYKLIYFTPKPGKLSILVYLQPQARAGMTDAELQFNLLFKALKEGTLAENLRINTDRISAIALSAGYEMPLSLHFSGKEEDFGVQNWSHQVVPNPASHAANLSIWAPTAQVLDLKIMDINGRIVETITLSCQGGENFIPLNMQRLSSNGLYYYSLQSKDLLLSGKFVVQER